MINNIAFFGAGNLKNDDKFSIIRNYVKLTVKYICSNVVKMMRAYEFQRASTRKFHFRIKEYIPRYLYKCDCYNLFTGMTKNTCYVV